MFMKSFIILTLSFFISILKSQNFIHSDPFFLLINEKNQYDKKLPLNSNIFRPVFFILYSTQASISVRYENYLNNNSPNQENMDVRYFSKGLSIFNSIQFLINNPYIVLYFEPYFINNKNYLTKDIKRQGEFSVLNDRQLNRNTSNSKNIRNMLAFVHYKGFGFGWHNGNKWWGPGLHTSLQMTNNTYPMRSNILGTINEIRIGNIGLYGLYSFTKLNRLEKYLSKYHTSLNASLTWYGAVNLTLGFSRNFLTGGVISGNYEWSKNDAKKIIFEGFFTNNLIDKEYTVGGRDIWDQTLSSFFVINMPERQMKIYAEIGFNDNRMFLADLISQPDHSMATIFGIRDYGLGKNKNWMWGFEWANLMISYTSRHRGISGAAPWYEERLYDYSSFNGRRWAAHSGADSDDWLIYLGYKSNKIMNIISFNYERHGIVSNRPAEVKFEYKFESRINVNKAWFSIIYEKQFEAFLGFPDYYYVDLFNIPIETSTGNFANSRHINTLILSFYKNINLKL